MVTDNRITVKIDADLEKAGALQYSYVLTLNSRFLKRNNSLYNTRLEKQMAN